MYEIIVTLRFFLNEKIIQKILISQLTKGICTIHGHQEIAINNIM